VRVGSTIREEGGMVYEASVLRPHPEFTYDALNKDIGVMILNAPIVYGPTAQPIKLVGENQEPSHGEMLEVTGWGLTKVNKSSSYNVDLLARTTESFYQRVPTKLINFPSYHSTMGPTAGLKYCSFFELRSLARSTAEKVTPS